MFRQGVKPTYEDKVNAAGGKWVAEIPKQQERALNNMWLNLMMAIVGETFSDGSDITGAVFQAKHRKMKISLWTKTGSDLQLQKRIGTEFKSLLTKFDYKPNSKVGYQVVCKFVTLHLSATLTFCLGFVAQNEYREAPCS